MQFADGVLFTKNVVKSKNDKWGQGVFETKSAVQKIITNGINYDNAYTEYHSYYLQNTLYLKLPLMSASGDRKQFPFINILYRYIKYYIDNSNTN